MDSEKIVQAIVLRIMKERSATSRGDMMTLPQWEEFIRQPLEPLDKRIADLELEIEDRDRNYPIPD